MKLSTVILRFMPLGLSSLVAFGQAASTPALTNAPPVKNPWDASAALGLTVTRGNSKTLLFSATVTAQKKWTQDEAKLGAQGVYGENDGVKNAQSVSGFGQYNHLFTERAFGYLRFDALHDKIADVDYRLAASPGAGYYFVKTPATTLSGEIGPGYIYEQDGPTASNNSSTTHSYMTLRLAERLEHKVSDHAKIWESVEILPQVDKFDNYIMNAEVGAETAMTKKVSLQAVLQDIYHSRPPEGRVKNDLKLIAALKYKF